MFSLAFIYLFILKNKVEQNYSFLFFIFKLQWNDSNQTAFSGQGGLFSIFNWFFFIINILNLVHTACFRNMRVSRIKLTGTVVLFLSISKAPLLCLKLLVPLKSVPKLGFQALTHMNFNKFLWIQAGAIGTYINKNIYKII